MSRGLALDMLREHRWSYVGLAVVLFASSVLVGSSLTLVQSAQAGRVDLTGLSANQSAELLGLAGSGRFISGLMAGLGVFVAVLLVSQTMSFVVEGRRRELALLRLTGASPRQVTGMVLRESVILGLVCSAVGALASLPLAGPYAELLTKQDNWPPGVPVGVHLSALVWCVVLMTLVSVVGAFTAARRIGRTPPIEAVQSVSAVPRLMPPIRWVVAGLGAIAVVVFLLLPPQSVNFQLSTAAVGGGAVLLVSALAPLVVPSIARLLGGALTVVAPGAALVARERTVHDARRSAALATPIILLLGLGAVFGTIAQTGRAESAQGLREITHAHAVAERGSEQAQPSQAPEHDGMSGTKELAEIGAITRIQRAGDWSWNEPAMAPESWLSIMGIDPATFTHFVPAQVKQGSLADVRGRNVAAISGTANIGDSLHLTTPGGTDLTVKVVATVESTSFIYGSLLLDQRELNRDPGATMDTWLAEPAAGVTDEQLVAALRQAAPAVQVMTGEEWIEHSVSQSVAKQQAAIFTIIGGAALLAVFSLAQSTLASVRERRRELELLTRIGARRRSAMASIVIESAITAATAAILAIAVTVLVYARMNTALLGMGSAISPIVPVGILAAVLLICVLTSTGSSAVGAALALPGPRLKAGARTA